MCIQNCYFGVISLTASISHQTLISSLALLRKRLSDWEKKEGKNITFLDGASAFSHLAPLSCGNHTVGGLLEILEPCIPLGLTENSLQLFFAACEDPQTKAKDFLKSCKQDFLFMLLYAKDENDTWAAIEKGCENLRQANHDRS